MAFVRETSTKIEKFLLERSFTCFTYIDEDLTEGELRKLGREIRDCIRDCIKKSKKVKVFCFFNGHGADFKET
jgi:hypothetical protein